MTVTHKVGDRVADAFPEHKKLSKISGESQVIGEFLDWLSCQGIHRATYVGPSHYLCLDYLPKEVLLARYFGISLQDLELEKRSMVKELIRETPGDKNFSG